MNAFRAVLEARNPNRGCLRSYRVEAVTDLFGCWLVEVTYGRIGSKGRTLCYFAGDETNARQLVKRSLRRRGTAPRRIGVAYQIRELIDPQHWLSQA